MDLTIGGAAIEALGILTVVFDIRRARNLGRALARKDVKLRPTAAGVPLLSEQGIQRLEDRLMGAIRDVDAKSASYFDLLAGGTGLRVVGVVLLLVGLGLSTAGNVVG